MSLADNVRVIEFPGRGTGRIVWDMSGHSTWTFTLTGESESCLHGQDNGLWPDQAEAELREAVAERFSPAAPPVRGWRMEVTSKG